MASYLAMVVIGRYRVAESRYGVVPLLTAVHNSLPTSVDKVMQRTPEVLDFLVAKFGPYPFQAAGGIVHNDPRFTSALENQSRPVYSSEFFTRDEHGVNVLVHELAHQWFGDSVSISRWRDIWLNEGFSTYAEWLWDEHDGGPSVQDSFDEQYAGFDWSVPTGDPGLKELFGDPVYKRGAMVVHALRLTIGDDDFFELLKTWTAEKRNGNATTDEFIAAAERVSGKPLQPFFQEWLFKRTAPTVPAA